MQETKYIGFTKVALPFGWLGNMAPFPVTWEGQVWKTTEALFQALRFEDPQIREKIRLEKSPFSAKLVAKSNRSNMKVEPLSQQDLANMELCVRLKIEQHPNLKAELKKTGSAVLFEDVASRKTRGSSLFWGAYLQDGELIGKNELAKIWMQERARTL